MAIRFHEEDVRLMGRTAGGVKGISLSDEDHVVGMDVVHTDQDVLIVSEKGYGKRTPMEEYRIQNRGGKGIKTSNITDKTGALVSLKVVSLESDIMIITASGVIIRTQVEPISQTGRNTQGVKLIRVDEGEEVATVARVDIEDDEVDELLEEEAAKEQEAIEIIEEDQDTEE